MCPEKQLGSGSTIAATGCTSSSLQPQPGDIRKRMGCFCGGVEGDAFSDYVCNKLQPATHWMLQIEAGPNATDLTDGSPFTATIYERAGTPPSTADPERMKYAYPGVFEGNLTDCTWHAGQPCTAPLTGSDCYAFKCANIDYSCPPADQEVCPGFKNTSCGKVPGGIKPYWMHKCNPLALPMRDKVTVLTCNSTQAVDGSFQCYFSQEGSPVGAIGMQCKVGDCVYEAKPPTPGPPPLPPPPSLHINHPEAVAFIAVAAVFLAFIGAVSFFIRSDRLHIARLDYEPLPGGGRGDIDDSDHSNDDSSAEQELAPLVHMRSVTSTQEMTEPLVVDATGRSQLIQPEPAAFSFQNIHYTVTLSPSMRQRTVLHGISGLNAAALRSMDDNAAPKKAMMAILGPSGAGKSSLLDILSGRSCGRAVEGTLRVDGCTVSPQRMRSISGYVHQDDVLPGTATVWEYMLFHATLRGAPGAACVSALESQLASLGLLKVKHSLIGDDFSRGISGGEKRRLSVAIELLTTPALLFLDEPTTGLDSTSAAKVVDILAALALRGVNIMLSIHQPRPDVLRLMDSLLLLSPTGRLVYAGPTAAVEDHLNNLGIPPPPDTLNVADFLLDYIITAPPSRLASMVREYQSSSICSSQHVRMEELATHADASRLPHGPKGKPLVKQFWVLSGVLFRRMYRHPFLVATGFVATLVAAGCLAAAFWQTGFDTPGIQNRFGLLFFILLFLSLMSLSSLPIWAEEMLLFFRERDSGAYATSPYFAARVLFDVLPLRAFPPLLFTLITYPAVGLHAGSASSVVWFTVTLVAGNTAAALLCMCLGALLPSLTLANMIGSVAVMLSLLLCGYMLNGSSAPGIVAHLHPYSFFSQAYENLVVTEFHDNPAAFYFTAPIDSLPLLRVTGDGVLQQFGYQAARFVPNLVSLGVYSVVCLAVTYVCLLLSQPALRNAVVLMLLGPAKHVSGDEDEDAQVGVGIAEAASVDATTTSNLSLPLDLDDQSLLGGKQPSDTAEKDGETAQGYHFRRYSEASRITRSAAGSSTAATSPHRRHASEGNSISGNGSMLESSTRHENGLEMTHSRTSSVSAAPLVSHTQVDKVAHKTSLSVDFQEVSPQDLSKEELPSTAGTSPKSPSDTRAAERNKDVPGCSSPDSGGNPPSLPSVAERDDGDAVGPLGKRVAWGMLPGQHRSLLDRVAERSTDGESLLAGASTERLPLAWHALNISVLVPYGERRIVEHVSGSTESSASDPSSASVLAILGPSGAGKSTLLDVLAGRVAGRKIRGDITVAGHTTTPAMRQRLCGYVLQDDILPETCTVREYLEFHAQLRVGNVTAEECKERVDDVIGMLDLTRCSGSHIGGGLQRGISGGENRRARIAAELLACPRLLLVDEATTGLDSTSAAAVVAILARLSAAGVTVTLSIHQPRLDIFQMLSHLLLLSAEGRMVFSGPACVAQRHFATLGHSLPRGVNIADFLLDVVIRASPEEAERLVHAFATSRSYQAFATQSERLSYQVALGTGWSGRGHSQAMLDALQALAKHKPAFKLQAKLLAQRKIRSLMRHPWLLAFAFCATLATALLMGAVYANMDRATPGIQNRFAAFFFVVLYLSLVSLSSIPVWQSERGLFLRERAAGVYDTPAYVATTVSADLLFMRMLPPIVLALVAYPLMGLRGGLAHQMLFCIAIALCNMAAASMNMALGAACSSTSLANMFGSIAVMVNLLFSGFLMSLHGLPPIVDALARTSIVRYAYNILAVNEFQDAENYMLTPFTPPGVDPATLPHKDVTGNDILKIFFFRLHATASDMLALVLLMVMYVALTALILHTKR